MRNRENYHRQSNTVPDINTRRDKNPLLPSFLPRYREHLSEIFLWRCTCHTVGTFSVALPTFDYLHFKSKNLFANLVAMLLSKFLIVKSYSKRVKILSLLKKSEKFVLLNKNDRFLSFFFFLSESHFNSDSVLTLFFGVRFYFEKFRKY